MVARPTTDGACQVRLQLSMLFVPRTVRASFWAAEFTSLGDVEQLKPPNDPPRWVAQAAARPVTTCARGLLPAGLSEPTAVADEGGRETFAGRSRRRMTTSIPPGTVRDVIVGVPTEIKDSERRVGLSPASVIELVAHGHEVLVEPGAGAGSGFADADYTGAGASLASDAEDVVARAEMIVKVKEPQPVERARLRADQTLFTYLHLAPAPDQAKDLMAASRVSRRRRSW